jgi:hypothetical protein
LDTTRTVRRAKAAKAKLQLRSQAKTGRQLKAVRTVFQPSVSQAARVKPSSVQRGTQLGVRQERFQEAKKAAKKLNVKIQGGEQATTGAKVIAKAQTADINRQQGQEGYSLTQAMLGVPERDGKANSRTTRRQDGQGRAKKGSESAAKQGAAKTKADAKLAKRAKLADGTKAPDGAAAAKVPVAPKAPVAVREGARTDKDDGLDREDREFKLGHKGKTAARQLGKLVQGGRTDVNTNIGAGGETDWSVCASEVLGRKPSAKVASINVRTVPFGVHAITRDDTSTAFREDSQRLTKFVFKGSLDRTAKLIQDTEEQFKDIALSKRIAVDDDAIRLSGQVVAHAAVPTTVYEGMIHA